MPDLSAFTNWDLLVLGIIVTTNVILGFLVYFENTKSPTRRAFLGFALATAVWGIFNYVSYHITPPAIGFIFLRLVLFAAIWETYFFVRNAIAFPSEEELPRTRKRWSLFLGIGALAVSILTLTPSVFKAIGSVSSVGIIIGIINGPAFPAFGITSIGFTVAGVYLLLRKTLRPKSEAEKRYFIIAAGVIVMFALTITCNFILPAFFNNTSLLQYGPLFVFPYILSTSYAIVRNKVFNVKIIGSELFIVALLLLNLVELIQSQGTAQLLLRGAVFISLLVVGVLLIKSILREVEQREKLQKLTEEMERTNAKLNELSTFKTQLLSLASHQIKSPLAVIKGFTDILLQGLYGPMTDKVKTTIVKIRQSADGLIALINTLLDLRKVDEGKMDFQFAKTNFLLLVGSLVEQLRPLADAKALEMKFSGDECMVNADEQKLRQVVQNLVDNAIKYTPSGTITVTVSDKKTAVVFAVEDSGLGISPSLLPHLFEEFVRDVRVKKEIRGTGLGLYIAKRIVEAHHGRIWAESAGEGKGSRFLVELPKYVEGEAVPVPPAVEPISKTLPPAI
jgi:signal transduction histidine kinase